MAPELGLAETIDYSIDMWSFGIVLYEMAACYKPTAVKGYKFGAGPIPFPPSDFRKRSKAMQNLIERCLEMDPTKRITAEEAIKHPWFSE